MSRLLLHTGAHKTGTTTLQHSFAQNRALLARHGVIYPDIGPGKGHHALTAIWCDRSARLPEGFFRQKGPGQILDEIVAAHCASNRTVLLSSEAFTQRGRHAVDMADLYRRVAAFDAIRVLHVLREQCGFIQSVYLELARATRMVPFSQFLERSLRRNRVAGIWGEHCALDDHLRASFAPEEIVFADFDRLRADASGLMAFFLKQAGAEEAAPAFRSLPGNRNISPEPLAFCLAQEVSQRVPGQGVIDAAQGTLREAFGARCRTTLYTRSEVRAVSSHFAALNACFAARMAVRQPDFILTAPGIAPDAVYREDISDRIRARFLARLEGRRALYRAAQPRPQAPDSVRRQLPERRRHIQPDGAKP